MFITRTGKSASEYLQSTHDMRIKSIRSVCWIPCALSGEADMALNIFAGVMCLIAVGAGVWSFILESGKPHGKKGSNTKKSDGRKE